MIEFNCPECVKPIQISGDITGRAYTCPHCGATVGIPDGLERNAGSGSTMTEEFSPQDEVQAPTSKLTAFLLPAWAVATVFISLVGFPALHIWAVYLVWQHWGAVLGVVSIFLLGLTECTVAGASFGWGVPYYLLALAILGLWYLGIETLEAARKRPAEPAE